MVSLGVCRGRKVLPRTHWVSAGGGVGLPPASMKGLSCSGLRMKELELIDVKRPQQYKFQSGLQRQSLKLTRGGGVRWLMFRGGKHLGSAGTSSQECSSNR